jgi:hypothetical protein
LVTNHSFFMKQIVRFTAILLALVIISGCATLFAPKTYPLTINSEPADTEIYVNGEKMGVTPLELNLKPKGSYSIEFRKDGFQSITRVVNTKKGAGWIVLDLLGGIIPYFIDSRSGRWYQLDQDTIDAVLEKQIN